MDKVAESLGCLFLTQSAVEENGMAVEQQWRTGKARG